MKLQKGLRVDHGYVQVRIFHDGKMYCRNFGLDSPFARELAVIHLAEKRKEILMGTFHISVPIKRMRMDDALRLYYKLWSNEKDAEGNNIRTESNAYIFKTVIEGKLIPFFGAMYVDEVKPKNIEAYKSDLIQKGGQPTTANKHQVILSSFFSNMDHWIKAETIKAIKLPCDAQTGAVYNPCEYVDKAPTVKRERLVTTYEISKLLNAAKELGDEEGRENIKTALKTCLSLNDLKTLKLGDVVDLRRSKSDIGVSLPITITHIPDWHHWRTRWNAIRIKAGLPDVEFRDLRKAGGNLLVGRHDVKLISQYMGHADQKTTEAFYTKIQADKMAPLAKDLNDIVDAL